MALLRLLTVVAVLALAACGDDDNDSPPADPTTESTASATEDAPDLVGTWEREIQCEELVAALQQAGLEQWVVEFVAGNAFVPGVMSPDEIANRADPCAGAEPQTHAHFFTAAGEFGSLDTNGEEVDSGTYEIVEEGTFVISKEFPEGVTFHYTVEGDTIMFEPEIPDCAPNCFEAAWSVAVAYPGEVWNRAD